MDCLFCGYGETARVCVRSRAFFRCASCGGVFLSPEERLDRKAQRERYLFHRNDPDDAGYRTFLTNFASAVLSALPRRPRTVFDYGSGPVPALAGVLDGLLGGGTDIRCWDPFFAPGTVFFPGGAELVTCLEVAEHFESPAEGFAGLCRACRPGGAVAVGTLTVPEREKDFERWWYKEDRTHVSFYSGKALDICGLRAGLGCARVLSGRIFLFTKPI